MGAEQPPIHSLCVLYVPPLLHRLRPQVLPDLHECSTSLGNGLLPSCPSVKRCLYPLASLACAARPVKTASRRAWCRAWRAVPTNRIATVEMKRQRVHFILRSPRRGRRPVVRPRSASRWRACPSVCSGQDLLLPLAIWRFLHQWPAALPRFHVLALHLAAPLVSAAPIGSIHPTVSVSTSLPSSTFVRCLPTTTFCSLFSLPTNLHLLHRPPTPPPLPCL